jgi:hypothetical protein
MTPSRAAEILDSWAKNAKTAESKAVCEMAAIGMRNAALSREIIATSDEHEMFLARTRNGPTCGGATLKEALEALREKMAARVVT